jgi:YD repeat-containing protein
MKILFQQQCYGASRNFSTIALIEKTGSLAQTSLPQPMSGNTFNAANEMTAFNGVPFSYDASGNLIADGTNSYAWDARNHLTAIAGPNGASFAYDPAGRRAMKTINGFYSVPV